MKRTILAILLAALWTQLGAELRAHSAVPNEGASTALAERLEEIRSEHDVPALGALLWEDGRIVAEAVAGLRRSGGDEPVTAGDSWHIGSCTKAMTATLAARLVERGLIGWDTTLAQALPEHAERMHERHRSATLRQLLAHRAAIAGAEADLFLMPAYWGIERSGAGAGGGDNAAAGMAARRLRAVEAILAIVPVGEPGGGWVYSNHGYILAGVMLERAGGADWEELMRREVFEPLGIESGGFGPPAEVHGHLRVGDAWTPQQRDNPPLLGPAGTAHLSLADWARFAAAHLGQVEGYLSPESLATLHEAVGEGSPAYALGWGITGEGDSRRLQHAGSNTMWFAIAVLEPAKGRAMLIACNAPEQAVAAPVIAALREASP